MRDGASDRWAPTAPGTPSRSPWARARPSQPTQAEWGGGLLFLGSDYCSATVTKRTNGKPQLCYAKQAGAICNESATGGTGSALPPVWDSPDRYFSGAMDSILTGTKNNAPMCYGDDFHLSRDKRLLLSGTQLKYPGGDSSGGGVNVSMVAGAYAKQGYTETNSFGMHIGSALPHPNPSPPKKKMMEGSLWFGGYDKNRVIGEVLAIPIPHPYVVFDGLPLGDISINVVKGGSPFGPNGDQGNG
ncbi:hypothetical protein PG985_013192 [Apiospora marii]|uniref:uncharacterized protein n=1 Tax=Apiospora marii TaxID=335849 RepID=UPI0031315733